MRRRAQPSRSWAAAAAVAAAALLAPLIVTASVDQQATVTQTAERLEAPRPALLVSDSAWLSLRIYGSIDGVQGFSHLLDLASCRRRVSTSCRNYDGSVPITLYEELGVHGGSYHTLIVATGYNDSDHNFSSDVDVIVNRARDLGYDRVVWLTLRANVSYTSPGSTGFAQVFANNNASLAEIVDAGTYPELVMADWATYAHDRTEWFASDGIHLRTTGSWAAVDYLSRKIAHLDGRPCPQPTVAGLVPADPCPDPDAAPPDVDLYSLYPIGQPNPTAVFELEYEGSGSWPDPPFWLS